MPFLAGTYRMRYPRFLAYNAAGGLVWGVGSVLLGFLAGNSYAAIEKTFGRAVALIAAALVVAGLIVEHPPLVPHPKLECGRRSP
jgi:membrane protein DedA with SNARE-associated domain